MRPCVFAVALLFSAPGTASAQFIEFLEWLDKLSGPGPFIGASVRIPILCVTRVTETVTVTDTGPAYTETPDEPAVLEWSPRCLGIVPQVHQSGAPRSGTIDAISKKERWVSVEFKFAQLRSHSNDLEYDPSLDDDTKVRLHVFGLGARFFPHQSTNITVGAETYRFSSKDDLFPSFSRHTFSAELGTRPLWRTRQSWARTLVVSVGIASGLGWFDAADFGSSGSFKALDSQKLYWTLGFDPWWNVR